MIEFQKIIKPVGVSMEELTDIYKGFKLFTKNSVALDLRCITKEYKMNGDVLLVRTGIAIDWDKLPAMDRGIIYAQVCSRSGLALDGVYVLNAPGIIDSDYREEICVILHILKPPFVVERGDRVAQLLFSYKASCVEFDTVDVERKGGFGSTGIK